MTYPLVDREAKLALALEPIGLHQPVAVGRLAILDAACMHHSIPIKPGKSLTSGSAVTLHCSEVSRPMASLHRATDRFPASARPLLAI